MGSRFLNNGGYSIADQMAIDISVNNSLDKEGPVTPDNPVYWECGKTIIVDMYVNTYVNAQTKDGNSTVMLKCNTYGMKNTKTLTYAGSNVTFNSMTLYAVIQGFAALKRSDIGIRLIVNNKFVHDAFRNGWVQKWAANEWKKSDNKPVENKELWEQLHKAIFVYSVTTQYVK